MRAGAGRQYGTPGGRIRALRRDTWRRPAGEAGLHPQEREVVTDGAGTGGSRTRSEQVRAPKAAPEIPRAWLRRLDLPAGHAAADGALALAQKVDEALRHLREGDDPEALHDFRVSMRRLRAWLSGFEAVLAVRGGTRRRLKRLARRTNSARDAEAALAWLEKKKAALALGDRRALATLRAELEGALEREGGRLRARVGQRWEAVASRLRKELMDRAPARGINARFGDVWADALGAALQRAGERRREAVARSNAENVHRYRISLKRVRYLLEPASDAFPAAHAAVKQAKRGQERAGFINDLQHLLAWLRQRMRRLAADEAEALLELRLEGRDTEARRLSASKSRRVRALVESGRLARADLERQLHAFVAAESRGREPSYARAVRSVVHRLRATSRAKRTAPDPAARRTTSEQASDKISD